MALTLVVVYSTPLSPLSINGDQSCHYTASTKFCHLLTKHQQNIGTMREEGEAGSASIANDHTPPVV
eukprot:scaffold257659_cov116-Cyclotella_meneghiniana.AAC.1